MDANGFDTLTRSLTGGRSRRGALASLLGGACGLVGLTQAEARKKRKKKKSCPPCRKRKKGTCKGRLADGTACPGGACRAGSCVAISCAQRCAAGCCSVAGVCLPGDAAAACGALGPVCQDCTAQGRICVNGQCQPGQQRCLPGSCGACQWCNATATVCEPGPSTDTLPCSSAACEDGKEGRCVGGQCQPIQPTCLPGSCPECQGCNATGTACETDPSSAGKPCFGVACGSGTVGICDDGQCACRPEQTCTDGSCPECWACNDTRSGCQVDESKAGLPCSSVTCAGGAMGMCENGQCVCQ